MATFFEREVLRRLRANQPGFHELQFKDGFNVLLAERMESSTEKNTRNATGKTTVIEILHFCLGSDLRQNDPLRNAALSEWSFSLTLDLYGQQVEVTRSLAALSRVSVQPLPDAAQELLGTLDGSNMAVADWKRILGHGLYGLSAQSDQADVDSSYSPSFRSLISYAIRRDRVAFSDPLKIYPQQPVWNQQVNVAYLLGLDWTLAAELQRLRDVDKTLSTLRRAARDGLLQTLLGESGGGVELNRVRLRREVEDLERRVSSFQIIEDQTALTAQADRLTRQISELRSDDVEDRTYLALYESAVVGEQTSAPPTSAVAAMYAEAQVAFPDAVRVRLEQVEAFHNQLIRNRRVFVTQEVERLRRSIATRDQQMSALLTRRGRLMEVLGAGGALQEYSALQAHLSETRAQLAESEARSERLRELERAGADTKVRRAEVARQLQLYLEEQREIVDRLVDEFDRLSSELYERGGVFSVQASDAGYRFEVRLSGGASSGVGRMRTLCFDLMLLRIRGLDRPDFLVHDSALYDGVDERQIRQGLGLARVVAEESSAQYFCTFNSDDVPVAVQNESWFKDGIIEVLDDGSPEGSLLGMRF